MTWTTWKPALALGAVLAATGAAGADDRDTRQLAGSTGTTMTLGGKGTAQQAATEDTELARGYRYYGGHGYHGHYGYRGGYGYYGGYGYRGGYGGYYGGYRGYYGGYYGGYRPAYYYTPRVYYSNYYYPTYYPTYYGGGFYIGISGNSNDATAINLGGIGSRPVSQPVPAPTAGDGTFPYDGGPANPVPLPKADPQMNPPANPSADLPVSFKPKPATSPYKYKAYGEK
ncbi:hypothetical protein VT84_06020 [Gemmata sp. SH-PL17]|uniref:hypothetical protein n=1 Tax=Gemmata sp. SH-PL17 TaxID=1630693 RepID=UPI00078CB5BB|nr:hypothetical protein [Gemmata sp. SH-PL17]AMV23931.1 hypothetical protein VT84_06020 [Gemmata sp. SH-PL17]